MTHEELCVRAKAGDIDARNELILQNIDFIHAQAWELILRYPNYDIREADLAQEGCIGMMRAVSTFDPKRVNRFLTYAKWWIVKYMKKHIKGDVKNQPPVRTIHYTIWYENNHPTDTRKYDHRPQEDRVFRYVRVEHWYQKQSERKFLKTVLVRCGGDGGFYIPLATRTGQNLLAGIARRFRPGLLRTAVGLCLCAGRSRPLPASR